MNTEYSFLILVFRFSCVVMSNIQFTNIPELTENDFSEFNFTEQSVLKKIQVHAIILYYDNTETNPDVG